MSDKPFPDVPGGYPFPELELGVLEEWRRGRIFERSLAQPSPRGEFVFYDGPPTANNVPHVGHVVTRVVKDLFPRFRTMQGFHVARKAGWDTHGLPVEIEVEKRLGFTGKQQIEAYGIEAFNRACLESVHTYERQWRAMSERVGYWMDFDGAYWTYSNQYVESVWWALAELAGKGLLEQGYKIQPYCARCGTTLSSHEVAQNYQEADDPSVWALFPARPGQRLETLDGGTWETPEGLDLVAWTTTPWTLLAHVALAVHPELTYRVVDHPDPRRPGHLLLFAEELARPVPLERDKPGEGAGGKGGRERLDLRELPARARVPGRALEGLRYDRPFRFGPFDFVGGDSVGGAPAPGSPDPRQPDGWQHLDEAGWRVVLGDYVTTEEGTGIVHTAIPFGEDDFKTGRRYRLPGLLAVDEAGKIDPRAAPFAGRWFKDADPEILRDLKERGRLLHSERYRHNYPFCWRCDRPLLYYATGSWFVRTTARKDELIAKNRDDINWYPAHVGEGRFGNWLENLVDWALSRRRYWGTPLPVWLCDREGCSGRQVIGSYEELFEAAGRPLPADPYDREQFDPHRPFIDEMTWPCPECGEGPSCGEGTMRRVPEVIDAWFDSGSMPFAQHHYPFENRELIEGDERRRQFPADFISEAVDQTRGWFYTLHALGVLLFDSVAFENCIVLGHVADESGRKMSKRLGNVVEPMGVIEETGADALRWYFCVTNPEQNSRFSARLVRESAQGYLLPLWNALSFFTIYANLDGWRPGRAEAPPAANRPDLDRWILLRLETLVGDAEEGVTGRLEGYDIAGAARLIEAFIDDLTNWYIRRTRDRFWAGNPESRDKEAAYHTLYEVLTTLARLVAPFTPFVADVLHRHLVRSQGADAPASVHLEAWPEPTGRFADRDRQEQRLVQGMRSVQRVVALGRAARNTHNLKTRQPLGAVILVTRVPDFRGHIESFEELIKDELNVREIRWADDPTEYVHHEVKPNFRVLGKRLGKRMPKVKAALDAADGDELVERLEREGAIELAIEDEPVRLERSDLEIRLIEKEGMATAGDRELLVALDTELTAELIAEGQAREVVHRIQTARKEADLDYADRIRVHYRAAPELEQAIAAHRRWIAGETLAVELAAADGRGGEAPELAAAPVEDLDFALAIERVES